MRRWVIQTANAALFVSCCWLVAGTGSDLLAQALLPAHASLVAPVTIPVTGPRSWADRQPILDRNLFGARLASQQPAVAPQEELEETKLPLKLLGTIAGEVANAAIQDTSNHKHQVVFVGDRLQNHARVEVVRIDRGRVILQNGAKREELLLSEDVGAAKPAASRQRAKRPPRRARKPRERGRRPPTARAPAPRPNDSSKRNPADLFSQARIVPKYRDADGSMVGIQINQIQAGSLYQKIGLQSGDVITSLNGIVIDSPAASAKILTEFTTATEFRVVLENGSSIQVSSDDLPELLGK